MWHGTTRLLKISSAAVVAALAIGAAMLTVIVPRLTGSVSLTVLTGSMSPTIPAGSMVLVKPLDPSEVRKGDVITFQAEPGESSYITHRVIDIENEGGQLSFVTKGDANRGADPEPVPAGAVRGRVMFHVPYVGRLAETVRSPLGALALVVVPCSVYIIFQARQLLRQRGDREPVAAAAPPASETAPERGVARALLMASTTAGPEGRRELALLASGVGGSVVDVRGDRIVVMVAAAPHVLDEVETQLRLRHSCDVRRSSVVGFGEDGIAEIPAVSLVVNGSPIETVRIPQAKSSTSARLRRASEDLRRHTGAPDPAITLDFTDRARSVREGGGGEPVALHGMPRDRSAVSV